MVNAAYVRAERIASHRAVPQVFGVDFVIFEGALVPQQTVKLGSATLDPDHPACLLNKEGPRSQDASVVRPNDMMAAAIRWVRNTGVVTWGP